ncbi:Uncharacterised protein [uncultured archaeon]|nr:Uncharacterised protein [uncultured archaeon]
MSYRNKAIAFSVFSMMICLLVGTALGVVSPALTISQLVTSGQSVTLQAPSGDYLYQWTAVEGGSTIGAGTSQKFTFLAPQVTQEEGSKTVTISLFIRTTEGGCVNQTSTDINVYSLPVCGIGGPAQAGPYDVATYSYVGGTTGTLTYAWNVDGKTIDGATGPNVDIDWSQYSPVNHTVGLTLVKDYSDVAPGSTNPFRTITCTYRTNITYTTGIELTKVPSFPSAAVGETVTYTYTIRNTGTIGIKSLALKDNKLGTINLATTTLMPDATASASATYTIKESDLPGPLNNTVTLTGTEDLTNKAVSATANATVALTYNAALSLTKVPSSTAANVGDTVTYRYTVTNTGNVSITGLNLTDDKLGTIKTDKSTIAPGDTATASVTHVILESELPGPLVNVATIQGKDVMGQTVTNTATATVALSYTAALAVTKTPSSTTAKVGDTVTYRFTVKNNGTVTVNSLALTDDKLGTITLDKSTLAPGDTATGSATHTIAETDLPGPLTNIATATAIDSQGQAVTAQAAAAITLTYTSSMAVTKTTSASTANVGQTVTYEFSVKNTGSVTINTLALVDHKLGTIALEKTTLLPGESANGTATHTVVEADLPGPLTNIATATATDSQGGALTATATATVKLTYTAALAVTKTPSSTTAAVGETITYQFAVSNTGNVTVNGLTLTDDKLGTIALNVATLAPGETATGSATHVVVESDLPGPLVNVATASATDSQGKAVTSRASASVDLTYTASLAVTKTPSATSARVGDTLTYSYTVRNTGTVSLTGLKLVDDKLKGITLDKNTLAPGEMANGSATYTVLESDLPGPLTNIATATASDSVGKSVTNTATASVTLTYTASMEVTKAVSSATAKVGDTLTYTYTVRNTGTVTINGLTLTDDRLGTITTAKKTLAAGETLTATATHVVVESDLPGPLTNVVTVTATDSQGQPMTGTATATVTLTYTAALEVLKVPSKSSAAVGDTITYRITINNIGTVTINGLTLTDDKLGTITLAETSIAAGKSITTSIDHVVTEADLPSPLTNIVTVTGTDSQGQPVTSTGTASVALTYTSKMEVTKTPSTNTAAVGATVTYSYTVKNSGSVTINALSLVDDKLGTITLDTNTIAPGASATGTATHTVVEGELPGPLTNNVTATGTDSQNNALTATAKASVALTYTASLSLTKEATSTSALWVSGGGAKLGDDIVYTYRVTNTGTTTVSGIVVTDDKLGQVTLDIDTLAPGESATGTLTHTVTQEDLGEDLKGSIKNIATSSGTSVGQPVQSNTATVTAGVYRDAILPVLNCVHANEDGSFTAFYGYSNPNSQAVTIAVGNNNKFTPPPDAAGQPTTFEPGSQTAVVAVDSPGHSLVWHLDNKVAEANKNSPGCSEASCGMDGPTALCRNKVETYSYTGSEDAQFTQSYEWSMDSKSIGSGKSIDISGEGYELGTHTLGLNVTRTLLDKVWSSKQCSMSIKVIPEPSADISMQEAE